MIGLPLQFTEEHLHQNEKFWRGADESELQRYADFIFQFYRRSGYPHYNTPDIEALHQAIIKTRKYRGKIINGKIIRQTMHLLAELWAYFPHYLSVKCGNSPTVMDVFNDDKLFKQVIFKRLKYGSYIGDSSIRKALRAYGGQAVSNFRPTAAMAIYHYAKDIISPARDKLKVWDMSAGWGGRITGAYLSGCVSHYIGNEPSAKTFEGLSLLKHHIETIDQIEHEQQAIQITIEQCGSENPVAVYRMEQEIDFCFTSPPYFDTERYSDEETQSFVKFPSYDQWKNGFLAKTIEHCANVLHEQGVLALNIANVAKAKTLEADAIELARSYGFFLHDTLQLQMSGRSNAGKTSGQHRYEPIFIFTKKERKFQNETVANVLF